MNQLYTYAVKDGWQVNVMLNGRVIRRYRVNAQELKRKPIPFQLSTRPMRKADVVEFTRWMDQR